MCWEWAFSYLSNYDRFSLDFWCFVRRYSTQCESLLLLLVCYCCYFDIKFLFHWNRIFLYFLVCIGMWAHFLCIFRFICCSNITSSFRYIFLDQFRWNLKSTLDLIFSFVHYFLMKWIKDLKDSAPKRDIVLCWRVLSNSLLFDPFNQWQRIMIV